MSFSKNPEVIDCGFIVLKRIPTVGGAVYYAQTSEGFHSQVLYLPKFLYTGLIDLDLVDEMENAAPLSIDLSVLFQGNRELLTAFIGRVMKYGSQLYMVQPWDQPVYLSIREKYILPYIENYTANEILYGYEHVVGEGSDSEREIMGKTVSFDDDGSVTVPIKDDQIALNEFQWIGRLTGLETFTIESTGKNTEAHLKVSVKDRDKFIHSLVTHPFSN